MKKILLGTALFLATGTVNAADSIRWNMVRASYHSISIDDVDKFKPTGFSLFGTSLITENVFVTGEYASISDDIESRNTKKVELTFSSLDLGIGYRYPAVQNTDFFGKVNYAFLKSELSYQGNSGSSTDNAYGAEIGIRFLPSPSIELGWSIDYTIFEDESDLGFNASAMYHFTNQFSTAVYYGKSDDTSDVSVSAVWFFQ